MRHKDALAHESGACSMPALRGKRRHCGHPAARLAEDILNVVMGDGEPLETSSQQTERPESRLAKVNLTRGP